jgi:hypothetical protein
MKHNWNKICSRLYQGNNFIFIYVSVLFKAVIICLMMLSESRAIQRLAEGHWRTGFGRRCGIIIGINISAFVWRPSSNPTQISVKIPAVSVPAHPKHKTTAFLLQQDFSVKDTNRIHIWHVAITMKLISLQLNKISPAFWWQWSFIFLYSALWDRLVC